MIVSARSTTILLGVLLTVRASAASDAVVHAAWRATSVASIAERIGVITAAPVVIDRRIDPTKRIDLDGGGRALEAVLAEFAESAGGEVASLRHSFRIVPKGLARRVADADAARPSRLAPLPSVAREALEKESPCRWEAGTPPRELVERLAEEASIPIGPLDTIPLDHLPAGSLPPLPLADRLDLLLAHYDLRIEAGQRGRRNLAIVPLGEVTGERHRERPAKQPAVKPKPVLTDRYTVRAEAPLEELLQAVAKKFGLAMKLDPQALAAKGVAAGEIVRINLEDAPRNQVLDAITKPLGLAWKIEGTTLEVR